jgi:NAD(P)-dependent dehydrogenase (short-subunit alcohol dehydrogenase family)
MTTVLITGCSTGFGLESALAFARRGDTTYASMRNPAKADKLRERADAEGLTVEIATLDVTDDESVAAAVAEIESRHGAVDVLVNNAGVGYSGAVEAIDMDRARALMETNVWGAVRTMRAVLPAMRAQGSGVIVNVSSVAGRVPASGHHGFYAASKHALNALTEAAATELEHFGVRVVSVPVLHGAPARRRRAGGAGVQGLGRDHQHGARGRVHRDPARDRRAGRRHAGDGDAVLG